MLQRRKYEFLQRAVVTVFVTGGCYLMLSGAVARGYEWLGTGTGSLLGGDLTDPDDDGDPEFDEGYDAIFDANAEPGFGGGEFAFNVFDNRLGPSNDKWCCGPGGGIPDEGLWVSAQLLEGPHRLTHFTVSSANDIPDRDPVEWAVQGSNDGEEYTDIYVFDEGISPWDERLQVIQFSAGAGEDFPDQTVGYEYFRFVTYNVDRAQTGAYYQVGEIEYFGEPGGAADALMAGDADMDCDFDQLDLVKVQVAGKYLTGEAATWGEGDWDGAPGGSVADQTPPPGNGLFDQLDIIAALNANIYLQGSYCAEVGFAAIASSGVEGDGQTSIGYHAGTGEVWVDAPAGMELTSINIDSAGGIFTGDDPLQLDGSFDNHTDSNIFKATFGSSFGSLSFGNVAQTGLSEEFVLADLEIVGSLAGGGGLGDVDFIYVPEPSTIMLLGLGLVMMLIRRRR